MNGLNLSILLSVIFYSNIFTLPINQADFEDATTSLIEKVNLNPVEAPK